MPIIGSEGAASSQGFGQFARTAVANYIEDVFSTWLYTGTGATQTITNGIDLAGKGGMVWIKSRSGAREHGLWDTARGFGTSASANKALFSNATSAESGGTTYDWASSPTSTGFSVNPYGGVPSRAIAAASAVPYASWTFRKQPKFFDVVTYTGDGNTARTVPHNLASIPGFIAIKATSTTGNWRCAAWTGTEFRRGLTTTVFGFNSTSASNSGAGAGDIANATTFQPWGVVSSNTDVNEAGVTYVAYLFAHNAGGFGPTGTDNVISCGSFTTDGSGNATVDLGYEPQWVMMKASATTSNWFMVDNMRGMTVNNNAINLFANIAGAETSTGAMNAQPFATGFRCTAGTASDTTYIYIAVRRGPMRTPTSGTSVFAPVTYTGTNVDNRLVDTGLITDTIIARRTDDAYDTVMSSRLQADGLLSTNLTDDEKTYIDGLDTAPDGLGNSFSVMNGFYVGNSASTNLNQASTPQLAYAFRRAPSFFDVVCYTGTSSARTVAHNLGVVPELIIVKCRNQAGRDWAVGSAPTGWTGVSAVLFLDQNVALGNANFWDSTNPTSTVFSLSSSPIVNGSTLTYVAYLFASCPGVSKVGSYTGTGATQVINCGFTAGARFVLIKATSTTGNWMYWDSARGIVSGNDPYLWLNGPSAAQVTNTDWVDTAASGFELSNAAGNLANSNGVSYIFLAIA